MKGTVTILGVTCENMRFESIVQNCIEWFYGKKMHSCVFMFHIVDDDYSSYQLPNISISKSAFIYFVDKIKQSKIKVGHISDIDKNLKEKNVYFSFDDVWAVTAEGALEYLEMNAVPYSLFVSEDLLGHDLYLSLDKLKELSHSPLCTVGFHAKHHKLMRKYTQAQRNEEMDCSDFEALIQKKIDVFAYPYGSLYACGLQSLRYQNSQYKYCFSTMQFGISEKICRKYQFFMPRINVNENNYKHILKMIGV